jgi:hypothetical protein
VRHELHGALMNLMQARDRLLILGEGNPLEPALGDSTLEAGLLNEVLRGRTFDERMATAQVAVRNRQLQATIERLAGVLRAYVSDVVIAASNQSRGAMQEAIDAAGGDEHKRRLLTQVQAFYLNYQGYDFVSFPVLYSTNVGEELCTTEVIRISPEDATSLIGYEQGDSRRKLAGTTLMHFGAFLEQKWRRNDMLWGRLDGAERLIRSLVPQSCVKICRALVRDAHLRILKEYFAPMASKALLDYSSAAAGELGGSDDAAKKLQAFLERDAGSPVTQQLLQGLVFNALQQSLDTPKLLEYFRRADGYQVNMEPTPTSSASAASRATTVIGKMLRKIGDDLQLSPASRAGSWAARVGQIAWGFVEVAAPGRLPRLVFHYWLHVAYLIDVVLIVGGVLLGNTDAEKLGWTLVALTLAANTITWLLGDWFAGRTRARSIVRSVLVGIVLALVAVGVYTVTEWIKGNLGIQSRAEAAGLGVVVTRVAAIRPAD